MTCPRSGFGARCRPVSASHLTRPARLPAPLRLLTAALCLVFAGLGGGCTTNGLSYRAAEKLGYAKRDILVSRVEDAREAQTPLGTMRSGA